MRKFFNGLCLVALTFSSHLAAQGTLGDGYPPSITGATIPSATQLVDSLRNIWMLSDGQAYENGKATPSSGVILLLCYGGIVYQENIHHNWWLWDPTRDVPSWTASSDPRVTSPSGTTVPVATQIVDGELNVWALSAGAVYEKGQRTPSSEVILLLYAKGVVYQENIHHDWWLWRNGAWVATAAPLLPSASGTAIPTAKQIVDGELDVWTVSGGKVYENHALTPSDDVILLLFHDGNVYQENIHDNWWQWNGHAWISTASDPRAGKPMAYVASCPPPCGNEGVTVIDTGTNRVTDTIPTDIEVQYMAVAPDAKHVYVAGEAGFEEGAAVKVIDTAQKIVVASIPLSHSPQAMIASPDGTKIYVLGSDPSVLPRHSTFYAIDTRTNVVVSTVDLPNFSELGPEIALSPDGKRLYVPGLYAGPVNDSGVIYVVNTATNTVVSPFASSPYEDFDSIAISQDNAKLYSRYVLLGPPSVAPAPVPTIGVFDPATGSVKAKIPGVMETLVAFSPDSQHLYGPGLNGIVVIDTATDLPTTAVANLSGYLAITPDGTHLYITGNDGVAVADTATYTVSTIIPVGGASVIAIVPAH